MRHLIGLALFAAGFALIWLAVRRRNGILAELRRLETAGEPDPRPGLHPSLAVLGDVVPPLMIGALAVMALKLLLAYAMTGADRWFSLVDVAGFLFLLGAWSTWFVLKARYRSFPPSHVQPILVDRTVRHSGAGRSGARVYPGSSTCAGGHGASR
jgi:hypothetical protein